MNPTAGVPAPLAGQQLDEAIAALCSRVTAVAPKTLEWQQTSGRILAEPVILDRPSPACDVSAMDGYALRTGDALDAMKSTRGVLYIRGEVQAGMPAAPLEPGVGVRIFTGAMVPPGADAVIPRELVTEHPDRIELAAPSQVIAGQYIRRQGENGAPGQVLAQPGRVIGPPALGALASCGKAAVRVFGRVRVGIIVTGGEVRSIQDQPAPWQLRDGNGPALLGLLTPAAWLEPLAPRHVADDEQLLARAIGDLLPGCDALLLTGGVSAGDYDCVPAVLEKLGIQRIFHKLAIRPGKPVLGAVDSSGKPVIALPGNPVSVLVTGRRVATAALRTRAGVAAGDGQAEIVDVADDQPAPAKLTWFPLVRLIAPGRAELVPGKGSGDWVAAVQSTGFVEVPPGAAARGPRRLYRWSIADGDRFA